MNGKIITVWGAAGSGKTTVATNLAAAMADRNCMVGIISSKLYYGELQCRFAKRVTAEKGLYKAILNGCDMRNMFCDTNNPNLFFLSVPNEFDGMLLSAISGETIIDIIKNSSIMFDYIIIDGSEELNNPISSVGLTLSSKIVVVHRVSAKDSIWNVSMKSMMSALQLQNKAIHIINGYDKTCDKIAFLNSLGCKIEFELPFIQNSKILENSGKLIYESQMSNGVYKKMLDRIASHIMMGG